MKKIVRIVWIGALSGLAFLVACCSTKGLTKAEKKQLTQDRDSIQSALRMHWMATPNATPVDSAEYEVETNRLQYQLDSINYRLGKNVDLDQSKQRLEDSKSRVALLQRITELKEILRFRESACVYGSPEVMKEYGKKTREMKQQLQDLENQLEELNKK